ncbi:hypothetical protein B296_00051267 [Ensete ventricosum]|uniref:PB1 domain-containing protein n=1 Tax=Ensete ventricosum TaxID=4639 RepID=A0A426YHJ9_ENSVE|nr:hypothetical protein B296_00051267 [Ensete ventricosum]
MPAINLGHLPPPIKKPRVLQQPPFEGQFPVRMVSGTPSDPRDSQYCCFSDSAPAGIQGARHAQFDISLSDLHLNKLQTGLFHAGFHRLDHVTPPSRISTGVIVGNPTIHDKPILTEQQILLCKSETMIFDDDTGPSSSDGNLEKTANVSDALELIIEAEHCKVFLESEDVGHSLDLSVFGSYEELYERLGDMFGIEKSEMITHVFYKDAAGALKHAGDEPFSNFMKTARRLTILTNSGSTNQQSSESLLPIV